MDSLSCAQKLARYAHERGYAGDDPYDALNSPLAGFLSLGRREGRIALTQLLRRSPVNLRRALLIKPGVNPKALALFLEGQVKLFCRFPDPERGLELRRLTAMLADKRSPNVSGSAWGYHFPWQNRIQLLPRYTPTIVNSAFAGHALLDCYEATGDASALETAMSIPDFMLKDLRRKPEGEDAFCFSYTPLDNNFVHNANMLGASLLARIGAKYGRAELIDPALCALRYSMKHQHDDGSWCYAETPIQQWIDSFHTGFNLEALRRIVALGLADEYRGGLERGTNFYADNFFLADGTPKYYHNALYLVDIHAPAEAICFFSGEGAARRELTERLLGWTLRNMYDARHGYFYFRKYRHLTIKTPYMRWSQAWAFRALSFCVQNGVELKEDTAER